MNENQLIAFFKKSFALKKLKRRGWMQAGIQNPESVADHTFGLSLLTLILVDHQYEHINLEKALSLAIIHDLGEYMTGDITPHDGVNSTDKQHMESKAIRSLSSIINTDKLNVLWQEYEENITAESKLVRELDTIEMLIQASIYHDAGSNNLDEFFEYAEGKIATEPGRRLYLALKKKVTC